MSIERIAIERTNTRGATQRDATAPITRAIRKSPGIAIPGLWHFYSASLRKFPHTNGVAYPNAALEKLEALTTSYVK